jgi:hypothetical protein
MTTTITAAVAEAPQLTDRELQDRVRCGGCAWLVAAVVGGRHSPPDLAGGWHYYARPREPMPWWPPKERTRDRRLRAVIAGRIATQETGK